MRNIMLVCRQGCDLDHSKSEIERIRNLIDEKTNEIKELEKLDEKLMNKVKQIESSFNRNCDKKIEIVKKDFSVKV